MRINTTAAHGTSSMLIGIRKGIGYAESYLRYLIHCIRNKEETEEERKEKLWTFFETKCADGQYKEFCALVEKYPNLSKEALIRKVLMETEYCYF